MNKKDPLKKGIKSIFQYPLHANTKIYSIFHPKRVHFNCMVLRFYDMPLTSIQILNPSAFNKSLSF